MAPFAGYDMPLWYASPKNEHLAVLKSAGLFDTSHMAVISVKGPDSFELLQNCFTNDLSACVGSQKRDLTPGRCVYGAFLTEQGAVVDDSIIFELEENNYLNEIRRVTTKKGGNLSAFAYAKDLVGHINLL